MNKRPDVKAASEVRLEFRVTKEEAYGAKALAESLGMTLSQVIRKLLKQERDRLETKRLKRLDRDRE